MLHATPTPKDDEKVKELGMDTAQTNIRRCDNMTKFMNLPLCTMWIVVCCCSTADCIERKLPLLALAMGWQSSRINEKNSTTQHVTG